MKKITLLFLMLFTITLWQVNAQSTINITNTGGSFPGEKWVSVTTAVDGGGTVIWAQGDGTQGNGSGLINENISLAPGTYYVNCYDQYDDSWDGTTISVTAYGSVLSDNGGASPTDGTDTDATSGWDGTADELEVSLMIVVPSPPACPAPTALSSTPSSFTETTLGWTVGGSETNWTVEYGATGFTPGAGTSMAATANSLLVTGLTSGDSYDFYVVANCGGSGDSTPVGPFTWSQPKLGDTCDLSITATVEVDCSTATPITIDYSTAADLGTTDLSCDTFGVNTGAWLEFTAPTSGAVKITFTDTNEYALFEACGGAEVTCVNTATNQADLTGLTGGAVYKLAVWKDSATTGTTDVCIEEVNCLLPTALNVSVVDATNATLSWTAGDSETAWEYVVQTQGTGEPTAAGTATSTNPVNVGSLTEGTDYEFYVRANCGSSLSGWAGPFNWGQNPPPSNDLCFGATVVSVGVGSCGADVTGSNLGATDSGLASASCTTANYQGGDVWFQFTVPADETQIDYSRSASVFSTTVVELYSGACGSLVEVDCTSSDTNSFTGLTAGDTYYLRFYDWSNNDFGDFTFCLGTPPACPDPSALSATNITETSADLGWTENGTATSWNIEFGATGFTPTGSATNAGVANPFSATSLTAETGYDFYVQADCGVDGASTWVGPFSFTTLATPPENDDCANAIAIHAFNNGDTQDASGATNNAGYVNVTGCGSGMNDGVWYTFEVVAAGDITVAITGVTGWDPELAVYSGSCGTFTCAASADSGVSGGDETVSFTATANTQYWVNIGYWSNTTDGSEGPFTINVSSPDTATLSTVLSVNSNTLEGFSLYPNPVKNELFLNAQDNIQEVEVYNLLGRRVMVAKPNLLRTSVSLESLSTGMYIVKVKVNDKVGSYKIIKE